MWIKNRFKFKFWLHYYQYHTFVLFMLSLHRLVYNVPRWWNTKMIKYTHTHQNMNRRRFTLCKHHITSYSDKVNCWWWFTFIIAAFLLIAKSKKEEEIPMNNSKWFRKSCGWISNWLNFYWILFLKQGKPQHIASHRLEIMWIWTPNPKFKL